MSFISIVAHHMSDAVDSRLGTSELRAVAALTALFGSVASLMGVDGVRRAQVFLHQVLVQCYNSSEHELAIVLAAVLVKCCPSVFGITAAQQCHNTVLTKVTRHVLMQSEEYSLLGLAPVSEQAEDQIILFLVSQLKKSSLSRADAAARFCAARGCELLVAYKGASWGVAELLPQHIWPMMTDASPEVITEAVRVMGLVASIGADQGEVEVVSQISEMLGLAVSSSTEHELPFVAQVAAVQGLMEVSVEDLSRQKMICEWCSGLSDEQQGMLHPRMKINLELIREHVQGSQIN